MKKQNRREFLKVAGAAALGAGLVVGCGGPRTKEPEDEEPVIEPEPEEPVLPLPRRMKLSFRPYELELLVLFVKDVRLFGEHITKEDRKTSFLFFKAPKLPGHIFVYGGTSPKVVQFPIPRQCPFLSSL